MAAAPRNPVARPAWLRLGVLALIVVAAYATMAFTGNMSPKLGLDLQGGTTVTLTPVVLQGGAPPSGSVDKAVDIIRQRVNALGVSSADVKRAGDKIEVAVPGKGRSEVLNLVGTTAELQFREVVTTGPGTPTPASTATPTPSPSGSAKPSPSPTPSPTTSPKALGRLGPDGAMGPTTQLAAFHRPLAATTTTATPAAGASASPTASAKTTPTPSGTAAPTSGAAPPSQPSASVIKQFQGLNCATYNADGNGPPDQYVVACDKDKQVKYLLAPARVIGTDVKSASATVRQGPNGTVTGDWIVQVHSQAAGRASSPS